MGSILAYSCNCLAKRRGRHCLNYFAYDIIRIRRTSRVGPAIVAGVCDRLRLPIQGQCTHPCDLLRAAKCRVCPKVGPFAPVLSAIRPLSLSWTWSDRSQTSAASTLLTKSVAEVSLCHISMKMIRERITFELGNEDAWHCLCENTPIADGFYPCDEKGEEMEPDAGWNDLYICTRCGRIIHQTTLVVLGRSPEFAD